MSSPGTSPDRRRFLKKSLAGATGLLGGLHLPKSARAELPAVPAGGFAPNAWIRIAPDDTVTFIIDRSEMGQGVITSLSMLLAEELECDWQRIRWEFAPADKAYFSPIFGMQGTGGSMSLRGAWTPTLKAGAVARDMLVTAAAQRWGVDKALCRAEDGVVIHPRTNARASYGSLAGAAAKLPVPADVPLKDPKTFKLVGKPTRRLDTAIKTTGQAQFGIDVRLPGMLHAVVARCPVFGGKLASFDGAKAKAARGVRAVVPISSGIAVIADNTWNAIQARELLDVKWDEGPTASLNSAGISRMFAGKMSAPGAEARKEGDAT